MRHLSLSRLWWTLATAALAVAAQAQTKLSVGGSPIEASVSDAGTEFSLALKEGQAVVVDVRQISLDAVITVTNPDGTAYGAFDVTAAPDSDYAPIKAPVAGTYKIVITPYIQGAKGQIAISAITKNTFSDILTLPRFLSPRMKQLWRDTHGNNEKLGAFYKTLQGPIVEPILGDPKHYCVTFCYFAPEGVDVRHIRMGNVNITSLDRLEEFGRSRLWFRTRVIPSDANLFYYFALSENVSSGGVSYVRDQDIQDPSNPNIAFGFNLLTLPDAPSLRESNPPVKGNPRGAVSDTVTIKSKYMSGDRFYKVYTPPNFDPASADKYGVVVLTDGQAYSGRDSFVPAPNILDNLINSGRIPPMIAVFVDNTAIRGKEMSLNQPYADFLAKELMPTVRKAYPAMSRSAKRTIIGGSSLGGLTASFAGLTESATFGNVLSMSGAYWVTGEHTDFVTGDQVPIEDGGVQKGFLESPILPVRFYLQYGTNEPNNLFLLPNRQFRDILRARNYDVTYDETTTAHDFTGWRLGLKNGLVALTRDWKK